jgi:hypothetical protein
MGVRTRPLTAHDREAIDAALRELRLHFHEWEGMHSSEHELVGFALYVGFGGGSGH